MDAAATPRDRPDAFERQPRALIRTGRALELRPRQRRAHDEHIVCRVTGVYGGERKRGAYQQCRADEQHDGEADLDEHEH
jgi:hypothetical protein